MADEQNPNVNDRHLESSSEIGHEVTDVSVRAILWSGVGLIVLGVLTWVTVELMFDSLNLREQTSGTSEYPRLRQKPGLPQGKVILEELERHRPSFLPEPAKETTAVSDVVKNDWIDKKQGLLKDPMKIAIDRLLQDYKVRPKKIYEKYQAEAQRSMPTDANSGR